MSSSRQLDSAFGCDKQGDADPRIEEKLRLPAVNALIM